MTESCKHSWINDNSLKFEMKTRTNSYLTEGLAAKHLSWNHGKLNFEFLCESLRSTTKMKLTTPIFHPQPHPRLRYPRGLPKKWPRSTPYNKSLQIAILIKIKI